MARGERVKKPWRLSTLDNYFIDDRAATVDRDPEANFVPSVTQYADDEYKVLQLPANPRGRPKRVTETARISQRQASKKAKERTSMLYEEYGQPTDEDEVSSEDSPVKGQIAEKQAEVFVATIRPCQPAATYSPTQKPSFVSMSRQAPSSCTPDALTEVSTSGKAGRKRGAETNAAAPRKRARRNLLQDREDLSDDREVTLGREIVGKTSNDIAEVDKVEEVIHVAVAPMTQAAPASAAPSQPTLLEAPVPVANRSGAIAGHSGKVPRHHNTDNTGTSVKSRSASIESRINSISLQWGQVEEIIVHERFVNTAYLAVAGLRSSIVDDLAREFGIIDYADITDHLNEIRRNEHEGARVEAARGLGRVVMNRMIVGIKSE
ncbi:hypothetical protein CGCS363_v008540 [Colletotrichum siamense]|uniref:uncharacterized protein n=1 Tax=Colletotrichum siamense TaxID=690259 RepID=UPI0018724474|nr:uncharacterized protein CGCS363_v008540 [Colletotrichum siamense]KAF5497415.1 hypothetical protein CGCS363_v008540 [Colletotrichum siamense]